MSKINVHDFLMQNGKETQYAIVEDGERIIPTCFERGDNEVLVYLCQPYVKQILKNDTDIDRRLSVSGDKEHIPNMIMGQFLYEINRFLFKDFPTVADDIIPITERECLLYLLELETADSLKVKRDSKESMRKGLSGSGNFDADTVNKVMNIFSNIATDYLFERK